MANQTSEEENGSSKDSESKHESESAERRPDADEPVTHEEHDKDALKKASERMLLREPKD